MSSSSTNTTQSLVPCTLIKQDIAQQGLMKNMLQIYYFWYCFVLRLDFEV